MNVSRSGYIPYTPDTTEYSICPQGRVDSTAAL
eukprot:SAG31_NODE_42299_length_272_cov_0.601156_2_plen_32_part_01